MTVPTVVKTGVSMGIGLIVAGLVLYGLTKVPGASTVVAAAKEGLN